MEAKSRPAFQEGTSGEPADGPGGLKSAACLSERPICRQTGRQADGSVGVGLKNATVIQISGRRRATEDQIRFLSLKCTQAKVSAPEEEQHGQDEEEKRPRVFGDEGKIEFQDLPLICCSA